ncbi:MAG: hypothetical protein QNJ16_15705 [Rhodobacter sp.]|nr:hypothetical protein [Rhodobacter sp.]
MRRVVRWLGRLAAVLLLLIVALLLPVAYVELACRGEDVPSEYAAILPPEHHRPEARTLLTYPEWHIVHAYDDYARVIGQDDPHAFGYLRAIGGFWSSLCAISRIAGRYGGVDGGTKQMVYTIGVSFTAELAAKAAYEETLGRAATWARGAARAPLDDLSARQATDYAAFLQQTPWYKWDFPADAAALSGAATGAVRDRERRLALGLEYRVKAAYAGLIAQAVAGVGADALRLRIVARGLPEAAFAAYEEVAVVGARPEGVEIETPRYRALTHLLAAMARDGAEFVEIAGNDDILLTALSDGPVTPVPLFSFDRQGYGDRRHLILLKVPDLAAWLRSNAGTGLRLEHIHDY